MDKLPVMLNDDYAVLEAAGLRFYYGYEVTENGFGPEGDDEWDEGEWCFQARRDGQEVMRIPHSKLPTRRGQFDIAECLLAGVALWIEKGCP